MIQNILQIAVVLTMFLVELNSACHAEEHSTFYHSSLFELSVVRADKELQIGVVSSISPDTFGSIFIGADDELLHYNGKQFNRFARVTGSFDGIQALYSDAENKLWVGSHNGLSVIDLDSGLVKQYEHNPSNPSSLTDDVVTGIMRDSQNRIWVTSWTKGINLYRPKTDDFIHIPTNQAYSGTLNRVLIRCIEEDDLGDLWLGSNQGIKILDAATLKFSQIVINQNSFDSLPNKNINVIMRDDAGVMWVGTSEGLDRYIIRKSGFSYDFSGLDDEIISQSKILALFEDNEGDIWVGTEGEGVSIIYQENDYVEKLSVGTELASDTILSITQDLDGYIWLGTSNGIVRYDKNNATFIRIRERDKFASHTHYLYTERLANTKK